MLNRLFQRGSRALARHIRTFASNVQKTAEANVGPTSYTQFSRGAQTDFGELPFGEIPEALKYDRPFSTHPAIHQFDA